MDEINGKWRTISGRRVFIKEGQSLHEAMIESGKFNKTLGLGSNDYNYTVENHPKPKLLLKLKDLSRNSILETLKKYEERIKDDKIENAIVITQDGEVYHCFGNKTNVWPDIDLGDKIKNSSITHNHPTQETSYSFSDADIRLFEKYKISKLRGIDNKYVYELDRNKLPSLNNPTLEDIIEDVTFEHLNLIKYAIDNNVSYMRCKND